MGDSMDDKIKEISKEDFEYLTGSISWDFLLRYGGDFEITGEPELTSKVKALRTALSEFETSTGYKIHL